MSIQWLRSCVIGGCLGLVSSVAHALPEFPQELQDATGAPCLPHCNVCHRDDNAGEGTVDRPFGESITELGRLEGGGVARAVARLQKLGTDSDGDGAGDIDEISLGNDPNTSYDARLCGPQVGCSLQQGFGTLGRWHALLGLALALGLRRSARRRGEGFP